MEYEKLKEQFEELKKMDLRKHPELVGMAEEIREAWKQYAFHRGKRDLVFLATEILGYDKLGHEVYDEMGKLVVERHPDKPYNLFLIPRDCMKTTFITITSCVWNILVNPDVRILLTNAVRDNALKMLGEIKWQLSENPKFLEVYGNLMGDVWNVDEITVAGRKRNSKELTIETGSPGLTKTSKHYDRIIADDLVTRDNIKTPESMYQIYRYFMDLLDLLDHPTGVIDVIGTRWDYGDFYGRVLDPEKPHLVDFTVFKRKAFEGQLEEGRLNFPWKLDMKTLQRLKRNKSAFEFSAQYQNEPVSADDAMFRDEYFHTWKEIPAGCNVFLIVDPASTQGKRSDFSAILVVAVDHLGNWYIIDIIRDKLLPGELCKKIIHLADKHDVIKIAIETVGFQGMLKTELERLMMLRMTGGQKRHAIMPISPKRERKYDRIAGLEPMFRAGMIFFPKEVVYRNTEGLDMDLVMALKDEFIKYPRSMKDDLSDTLAYGLEVCFKPIRKVEYERNFDHLDNLSKQEMRNISESKRLRSKILALRDMDDYA